MKSARGPSVGCPCALKGAGTYQDGESYVGGHELRTEGSRQLLEMWLDGLPQDNGKRNGSIV